MAKRRNSDKIIPEPQLPKDITIKFSFRCYDDTGRYCLSKWEKDDVSLALQRLKEINCKTYNELHQSRFAFSFHPVNWATTTEKDGYSDNFLTSIILLSPIFTSDANVSALILCMVSISNPAVFHASKPPFKWPII